MLIAFPWLGFPGLLWLLFVGGGFAQLWMFSVLRVLLDFGLFGLGELEFLVFLFSGLTAVSVWTCPGKSGSLSKLS